jgi:hypothetical protein
MCTAQIRAARLSAKADRLSSGGYEGGGAFTTRAMTVPGSRRRNSRLPEVPLLGISEDGAI